MTINDKSRQAIFIVSLIASIIIILFTFYDYLRESVFLWPMFSLGLAMLFIAFASKWYNKNLAMVLSILAVVFFWVFVFLWLFSGVNR